MPWGFTRRRADKLSILSRTGLAVLLGCGGTVSADGRIDGTKPAQQPATALSRQAAPDAVWRNMQDTQPEELLAFARAQLGLPYRYGSANPVEGFDCSGFVTYVFKHFGIALPRSSKDYAGLGPVVGLETARPGDLILFTGTDSGQRIVGHVGIVEGYVDGSLNFLHSSSGNMRGVIRTAMQPYYFSRFFGVIRVFSETDIPSLCQFCR